MQYTSGSTGDPKGVMLTHANLLANIRAMGHAMEASSADVFVSWLPLYHDMGLIGAWLGCLLFRRAALRHVAAQLPGAPAELAVDHASITAATFSGGPNFAFELCASRIDEADLQGLDLSAALHRQRRRADQPRRPCAGSPSASRATAFEPRRGRRSTGLRRTASAVPSRRPGAAR